MSQIQMKPADRIYFDNAATSWPKPESVYLAIDRYQREVGAPAGRGAYREAVEVERLIGATRQMIASLIKAEAAENVVFTANGTDSLNLVLHGLLRPGDHVVTSVVEHNSVLRPLRFLEDTRDVTVTRVGCDGAGFVDPDDVRSALRPNTKLVAIVHASNVTGALQPVQEIGNVVRECDAFFLIDAAQTLGHVPIDVGELHAHFLAAPGHKGLLGPLGTGVLYVAPEAESQLTSSRQGGTGTQSSLDVQPAALPYKFESGNLNVPGIVGLGAGVRFLAEESEPARNNLDALTAQLVEGLVAIPGVTVFGPAADHPRRVAVVSITLAGYHPDEVASALDTSYRIQSRAGFHCAPLIHQALGTDANGGTLRFSPGLFSTRQDVEAVLRAVAEIAAVSAEA